MSSCASHSCDLSPRRRCGSGRPSRAGTGRRPARRRDRRRAPRRLAPDGAGDGVCFLAAVRIGFGDAVIARELFEPPGPPAIDAAVACPQHGASSPARQQRDDRAAAAAPRSRRDAPSADQVVVHLADALARHVDESSKLEIGARMSASASQTMRLATSPSLCPPEPVGHHPQSNLGRSTNASWLICATRPTSVAAADRNRGGAAVLDERLHLPGRCFNVRRQRTPLSLRPRAVEQRRKRSRDERQPFTRSGSSARRSPSPRSTTATSGS